MLRAIEQSTGCVTVSFKDESGAAVVPDSAKWTLVNNANNVVNNNEQVEIAAENLSSEITIVLSGDDLKIFSNVNSVEARWLIVEATYTSDRGAGLPLNQAYKFEVVNLKYIK